MSLRRLGVVVATTFSRRLPLPQLVDAPHANLATQNRKVLHPWCLHPLVVNGSTTS